MRGSHASLCGAPALERAKQLKRNEMLLELALDASATQRRVEVCLRAPNHANARPNQKLVGSELGRWSSA
eukprot:711925-Pleurochrysis_carterae.AAC.1